MKRVWLWWSSGKDSAWTLHELRQQADVEVVALVTTVNERFDRVAMHAVRRELLEDQARAAGLELRVVLIPHPCSNEEYEAAFRRTIDDAVGEGIELMAFGDIFLEDVRSYRENLFRMTDIEPLFPLWGRDTRALSREMIASGLRAKLTCLDPKVLPKELVGRELDAAFLAELPPGVDPCGERGEFHTFAWAGPCFSEPVPCTVGETVERDGFVFADLLPRVDARR